MRSRRRSQSKELVPSHRVALRFHHRVLGVHHHLYSTVILRASSLGSVVTPSFNSVKEISFVFARV